MNDVKHEIDCIKYLYKPLHGLYEKLCDSVTDMLAMVFDNVSNFTCCVKLSIDSKWSETGEGSLVFEMDSMFNVVCYQTSS